MKVKTEKLNKERGARTERTSGINRPAGGFKHSEGNQENSEGLKASQLNLQSLHVMTGALSGQEVKLFTTLLSNPISTGRSRDGQIFILFLRLQRMKSVYSKIKLENAVDKNEQNLKEWKSVLKTINKQ